MSGAIVSLGDICQFKYGRALPATARDGGTYPVYGSNGIVGRHSAALTRGQTIVVGRKGSLGELNFSESPCWPIDTTYFVDETCTTADLRWLFRAMGSLGLTELNRAAAVPGLNRNDAYEKRLLLPPLEEQRRIAAILDKADALRAKRRYGIAKLDQLLQSVFIDLFGDPVVNPKGWQMVGIADMAEVLRDGPFGSNLKSEHYQPSGVRVIRLQNIGVWKFLAEDAAYISEKHFESLPRNHCRAGDVLIGTLGEPNLRACILPADIDRALNKADCLLFRPKPDMAMAEYVCGLLNCETLIRSASGLALGQTRLRVSMGRLKELRVPLPPLSLQQRFANWYERFCLERARAAEGCAAADSLFKSLQDNAFSGQLVWKDKAA